MADGYDLIVIGAGNAGQEAASVARAAGWRVAIVEARDVGGTCPLRGCVPKKVLAAASEAADLVRRAPRLSIHLGPEAGDGASVRLDWTALIARERTFVEGVPAAMKADLLRQGIDVVEGRARFVEPHAIAVTGRDEPLRARKFLVATGIGAAPTAVSGRRTAADQRRSPRARRAAAGGRLRGRGRDRVRARARDGAGGRTRDDAGDGAARASGT